MNLNETVVELIDGTATTFGKIASGPVLVVNVASKCGLTPQYEALEALQKAYAAKGFTVVGVPTDQFKQEPGSNEQILDYCSTTWGVTFPMLAKTKVNGQSTHRLYQQLKKTKDSLGLSGPIMWNFEKFLVLPNGEVHRFRPTTKPDSAEIVQLIEANL